VEVDMALPAYVAAERGGFNPLLLCGPEELIDAALRYRNAAVAYRTKALEYGQVAEALANLASRRLGERSG